jgi:hypothetical protein
VVIRQRLSRLVAWSRFSLMARCTARSVMPSRSAASVVLYHLDSRSTSGSMAAVRLGEAAGLQLADVDLTSFAAPLVCPGRSKAAQKRQPKLCHRSMVRRGPFTSLTNLCRSFRDMS